MGSTLAVPSVQLQRALRMGRLRPTSDEGASLFIAQVKGLHSAQHGEKSERAGQSRPATSLLGARFFWHLSSLGVSDAAARSLLESGRSGGYLVCHREPR